MAWTWSATPTERSHLTEREGLRKADSLGSYWIARLQLALHEQAVPMRLWPMHRYATIASITHLTLLSLSAALRVAVTPAQASAGATLGASLHLGLLVFSGTTAVILMLAANRQSARYPAIAQLVGTAAEPATPGSGGQNKRRQSHSLADRFSDERRNEPRAQERDRNWAELMARASHDLRTPLNAVIGFSDVMQRELLGPIPHERYREYIAHIRESGFALLKSTEDTLALTSLIGKTGAAQIGPAALSPILRQAWLAVPHDAGNPDVELLCDVSDEIVVACDRAALRQALVNLLGDAISTAAPRTPITVTICGEGPQLQLKLSCQRRTREHCATHGGHQSTAPQDCPRDSGLAIVMARALLELQDAELIIPTDDELQWSAIVYLNSA